MTQPPVRAAIAALGLLMAAPAFAVKVPLYDDFSSPDGIDRSKWFQAPEVRVVKGKQADLGRRLYGATTSDVGLSAETYGLNMVDPTPPSGLSADITVVETSVEGCPANPEPSFSRARLAAAYFNRLKTPTPGDRTGDVIAQVRVGQTSASPDLTVAGVVSVCLDAGCNSSSVLYQTPFANATLGTALNARIDWIKSSKTFRFTVDGTQVVDLPYTESHSAAPVLPFVQVAIRNEAANCTATRVRTGLEARFDNVRVAR